MLFVKDCALKMIPLLLFITSQSPAVLTMEFQNHAPFDCRTLTAISLMEEKFKRNI